MPLTLQLVSGEFAVCRLARDEPLPGWADSPVFSSVIRTADELSVICPSVQVPAGVRAESDWRVFKFVGPFEFSAVGVLASVAVPLAQAGISQLSLATFDTDYMLVKVARLEEAVRTLEIAGHTVRRS